MGAKCCSPNENNNRRARNKTNLNLAPTESEIDFPNYSSSHDKIFNIFESTYNLYRYIPLADYVSLLAKFTLENATLEDTDLKVPHLSKNEPFFTTPFCYDFFQSFIEQKMLRRPQTYEMTGNDEHLGQTFTAFNLEMYKGLNLKLNQYYGNKDPDRVKKGNLFCFGLLYCHSTNIEKIKFLFDIFKDENNKFVPSKELDEFMFSMFILPSYALLDARRKVGNNNEKVEKMTDEQIKTILDTSEFKDSKYLVTVFNTEFFDGKKELSYEEFKEKFKQKDNGFGWIFSSKGIRNALEKNNV